MKGNNAMIRFGANPECPESLLLWRVWFEKGHQALQAKDYPHAVEWLLEALRHVAAQGPNALRHARTQAALGYAYFRNSEHLDDCAEGPCMSDPVRYRYQSVAAAHRQAAYDHAQCALPCLTDSAERTGVARGQAHFVLGMLCLRQRQYEAADKQFELAYYALNPLSSAAELLAEVFVEAFNVSFRTGNHERARFWLVRLEPILDELPPGRPEDLSWLLACKAAVLLHLGRYQQADALRQRWHTVNQRCADGYACSAHCAYALQVFGRARMLMGYYDDATCDLAQSQSIADRLKKPDRLLHFDLLLTRAELARRLGRYGCACQLLAMAEPLLVELERIYGSHLRERLVRMCLVKADFRLALGEFTEACACYESARQRALQDCRGSYLLLAPALLGIARIHTQRSRIQDSLICIRQVLALLEQAKATLTAEMARALHELAFVYVQDNKPDEAEPVCERALQTLAIALRTDHPDSVAVQVTLAESLSSQHKAQRAIDALEVAEHRLQSATPDDLFALARLLLVRAETLHARRDAQSAMCIIKCAINLWVEQERRVRNEFPPPTDPNHCYQHQEKSLLCLELGLLHAFLREPDEAVKAIECCHALKLLRAMKCGQDFAGYELNRLANQFFKHKLYREAAWLYNLAECEYCKACGPQHAYTVAVRKRHADALERLNEPEPQEICACAPWYVPCAERIKENPCRPLACPDLPPELCGVC